MQRQLYPVASVRALRVKVISWNVNGLRAATRKGFASYLETSGADVLGIQEVRAFPAQLDPAIRDPEGWHVAFSPAVRPGYSGVALYSRQAPDAVETSLGADLFDVEGRFLMARFGRLSIATVYFPKGSGKDRDNSRVPYKLAFYAAVFARLEKARRYGPVLMIGDYNTAHTELDLARPATNRKSSGFLAEERAELTRWTDAGWVDLFRSQHPGEGGHYSWWRQWGNAREQNVGWRIDYVFGSRSAAKRLKRAFICPEVTGSDHCPVGVELNPR